MQMININVISPTKVTKNEDYFVVGKTRISIGETILERLKITPGEDYILIGNVGTDLFISKKPTGVFGFKVTKVKDSNKGIVQASDHLAKNGVLFGIYEIKEVVISNIKNEQSLEIPISWLKLNLIKKKDA